MSTKEREVIISKLITAFRTYFEVLTPHYQKLICVYQTDATYRYRFALEWQGLAQLLTDFEARGSQFLELSCYLSKPQDHLYKSFGLNLLLQGAPQGELIAEILPARIPLLQPFTIQKAKDADIFLEYWQQYIMHMT